MARKRIKPKTTTQRERVIAKLVLSQSILDSIIEIPKAASYLPTLEFLKSEVDEAIVYFRIIPDVYGRPPAQTKRNVDRALNAVYSIVDEVEIIDEESSNKLHSPQLYLIMSFEIMMVDVLESMKNPINQSMIQSLVDSAMNISNAMDPKDKNTATYEAALDFVNKIYAKMRETWI